MKRITSILAIVATVASIATAGTLKDKVIYVNPGHGGWTANDRPIATINYEVMDTMGFFETKTNLWKGLELRDRLTKAGAKVVMSRTRNGYVTAGQKNATPLDRPETYSDENGQQQLTTLQTIAMNVDSINPDYFVSMHSNATGGDDGKLCNYLVLVYRGETGNDYAKGSIARAEQAYPFIWDNPLTVWTSSSPEKPFITGDLTWMGATPPGNPNALGYTGYLGVMKHRVPSFLAVMPQTMFISSLRMAAMMRSAPAAPASRSVSELVALPSTHITSRLLEILETISGFLSMTVMSCPSLTRMLATEYPIFPAPAMIIFMLVLL